jgi:cyclic pyranopterin phosphate synthase
VNSGWDVSKPFMEVVPIGSITKRVLRLKSDADHFAVLTSNSLYIKLVIFEFKVPIMGYDYPDQKEPDIDKANKALKTEGGEATAKGSVVMNAAAYQAFMTAVIEGASEAWTIARVAGILGAKQADEHILISHSFNITGIEMDYSADEDKQRITVRCQVRTSERIGAETAALVGCGTALMVLVDSMRAIDRDMSIEGLHVVR